MVFTGTEGVSGGSHSGGSVDEAGAKSGANLRYRERGGEREGVGGIERGRMEVGVMRGEEKS